MSLPAKQLFVNNKEMSVSGRITRTAKLKAEYYEWADNPQKFVADVKNSTIAADILTLLKKVTDENINRSLYSEQDSIAVLPIVTFEHWWKKQINDKTRNMIRRSQKNGVEVRVVEFTDGLVDGIKKIYDESPIRQGKPFKHYNKDTETVKNDHISFLERSQFIGAYCEDELIGFAKIVHDDGISHLMQIISKIGHRSKAPTNALIAKAVELCEEQTVPYLHYGVWSTRGLGDFKKHHAFERFDLTRYFIPLNGWGKLMLHFNMHRSLSQMLPDKYRDLMADLRGKWNYYKVSRSL